MDDYIDINYSGRTKIEYTIDDVYKKINNYIKKNKSKFTCEKENCSIFIKCNDNISDDFEIDFTKNKFEGYCRISYSHDVEKSSLEELLDILFSIKMCFSKIEIEDDYEICKSYWNNKKIKIEFLEITREEENEIKELYDNGAENYKIFIVDYLAKFLDCSSYKKLYFNQFVVPSGFYSKDNIEDINKDLCMKVLETWLYEATKYKDKRLSNNEFYNKENKFEYQALNATCFDIVAFWDGIMTLISNDMYHERKWVSLGVHDAQVKRFYRYKIVPLLEEYKNNSWEQCKIAYRYLKSILKYMHFEIIGKESNINNERYIAIKYGENLRASVKEAFEYVFSL